MKHHCKRYVTAILCAVSLFVNVALANNQMPIKQFYQGSPNWVEFSVAQMLKNAGITHAKITQLAVTLDQKILLKRNDFHASTGFYFVSRAHDLSNTNDLIINYNGSINVPLGIHTIKVSVLVANHPNSPISNQFDISMVKN